jgi:hypothetical protein
MLKQITPGRPPRWMDRLESLHTLATAMDVSPGTPYTMELRSAQGEALVRVTVHGPAQAGLMHLGLGKLGFTLAGDKAGALPTSAAFVEPSSWPPQE